MASHSDLVPIGHFSFVTRETMDQIEAMTRKALGRLPAGALAHPEQLVGARWDAKTGQWSLPDGRKILG